MKVLLKFAINNQVRNDVPIEQGWVQLFATKEVFVNLIEFLKI